MQSHYVYARTHRHTHCPYSVNRLATNYVMHIETIIILYKRGVRVPFCRQMILAERYADREGLPQKEKLSAPMFFILGQFLAGFPILLITTTHNS